MTGDLNAAEVEWIVQYRINDPRLFLFNVLDPEGTLRYVSESVMRTVVGDRTVDEVITIGRQEIEEEARDRLETLVKKYELGIGIDQIQLQNVNPPPPVQASFNEVNQAQQERERMINEANGEYNKEIPRSRGVADQKIQSAEGYALKRVNEALGDVARFNAEFEEFQKAPNVTRTRLYLETLKEVVPQMGKKIVIDEDASQILPLLQLNSENAGGLSMKFQIVLIPILLGIAGFTCAPVVEETDQVILPNSENPWVNQLLKPVCISNFHLFRSKSIEKDFFLGMVLQMRCQPRIRLIDHRYIR